MNPLTQIKQTQLINQKEAALGIGEDASWHAKFKDSAYVFVGGIPFDLTEGDLLAVFAQYGEVVDMNLVRDKATGKSRGFAFVAYEDQRSTTLAVDNLNGAKVLGRTIRVEHVGNYKKKEEEDEEEEQKKREERGVCYAFQKGECSRGASCRYSHDEQRNANTGWGSKEDSNPRWEHDRHRDPSKKGETRGVCYAFQKGECDRGTSCRFSHDEQVAVQARGVCYAFQKGECNRGASCRFSHDEQRNANNGSGSKEDNNARREHHMDLDPPKIHKNFPSSATDQRFPDRSKEDSRSVDRGGHSSRSEVYRDRDSRMGHGDRNTKDKDRHRHDRSPERSRSERHRSDDRYMHGRGGRSEKYKPEDKHDEGDRKRSRHDRDSTGRYERRGDEEAEERHGKSRR